MEEQCSSKLPISSQKGQETKKIIKDRKNYRQKNYSDEIFEENNVQNMAPTFQKSPQQQPKSSQVSTQKISDQNKKSVFHNFQKHLVITLRKSIKIRKSSQKKDEKAIASEIWENFLSQSKVYTKNILHILFGVTDYEGSDLNNIYDEQIIEKFGYEGIFSKYSEEMLTRAQGFLRFEVIRQVKKMNLTQVLRKRRLSNSEKFIEYVKEFVGELEEGPMRKRLPKSKKAEMKLESISKSQ